MRESSPFTQSSKAFTRSSQVHATYHMLSVAGELPWLPIAASELADGAAHGWTCAAPAWFSHCVAWLAWWAGLGWLSPSEAPACMELAGLAGLAEAACMELAWLAGLAGLAGLAIEAAAGAGRACHCGWQVLAAAAPAGTGGGGG